MDVARLDEGDAKIILQVLNQVPNFLTYGTRHATVEPVADTLRSLLTRLRKLSDEKARLSEVDLSEDEADAVRLTIPEVVNSLGTLEFSLRTGYSTTEALAVLDHLGAQ
jgi:hypothetical protein